MPTFKIIQSMEDIRLSNRWSDSEVSENEDKHFNARGRIVNDNYDGPRYQVISEKQRALSLLERSGHIFLGSAAVICSLGLAYFSRSIRKRFIKDKKTIYFAMPLEGINTAKFAAQKFIQLFGTEAIQHINTTDQRILFELAKLVAQGDGKRISEEIENYGIIKEEDRVEVAKFAAQQNGEETSKYIKNYAITAHANLAEIARFAAQQDGSGTSKYIKNYGITNEEDRMEVAKIAAEKSGQGTSKYIKNYEIIKQKNRIEIAETAAQQDGRGTSEYIKNYDIIMQEALIKIAKIAAQQDGRGVSEYIKNYGITKEEERVKIAKFAAQQDGNGTSFFIENYSIIKQKSRMEIAKLAAQQGGSGTSFFIENYGITSQKVLAEIAKLAAQQNGSGTSEYIKKYGIAKEEERVEIAKLAAQQNGKGTSFFIESYGITSQKVLAEIAKLAAQQNGSGTSEYIKKYGIAKEEERAEIAKLAAQQSGYGISLFIKSYAITKEEERIKIAKFAAQQNGWRTSEYIKNYGITNQETLIEIAKLAAQQNGGKTSEGINNYGITDQKALIEIAKNAAQQDGSGTSKYIRNYEITDQEALIKIAMLAAQQSGEGISLFIKNYGIKDQKALIEIAYLAIQMSIFSRSISGIWDELLHYGLSKEELKKAQLLYASHYALDDIEHSSMQEFVNECTKSTKFPSFAIFDQKITEIEKQISREQDPYKLEKLQKKKQRALLCFSLVSNKCREFNISLSEDQQSYFIKALEHRNQKESCFLMQTLAQNFEKPNYFSCYEELVDSKKHLILPMILINQWLIKSLDPTDDRITLTQIENFLKLRPQRESLRSAKGFLPNLLQALIALSYFSAISSKQKLYLLNQCFQFVLPIEGKEWEAHCKQSLDTVNILAKMNLLEPILGELENNYTFKDILPLFNTKVQGIFFFDRPMDSFYEKYLKMEESLRIPLALVKYASNLKNIKESSVSQELQRLARHILEGSVKQERYQTENNPHLTLIKEDFPKTFQAWQITQEAIEFTPGEAKQKFMDFFAFLKEKILIDKHWPQAPLTLKQYLRKEPYSTENMKETDQQIVFLCEKLCDPSVDIAEKLTILKELSLLVGQNLFKNDIDSLYMNLTTITKQKSVLVVDSDDWQDLFLSGTEVLGSCQRIDEDPSFNVCLMAYVLDGKNRILCIKDPLTGKILARCIFRLLFKDDQLVLFQERIYPSPCDYEELLNELAETRSRELGLELFTCNTQGNLSSEKFTLESKGSCSPYEYVDASFEGKTKGVFRIHKAKKVPLEKS